MITIENSDEDNDKAYRDGYIKTVVRVRTMKIVVKSTNTKSVCEDE